LNNHKVGGVYFGFDQKVHKIDDGSDAFYSEMSLWFSFIIIIRDTFRTQKPFLSFFKPKVQRDVVRSLLNMFDQGGALPKWPIGNGEGYFQQ
jgi:putative alpha-1,2-mannosidase